MKNFIFKPKYVFVFSLVYSCGPKINIKQPNMHDLNKQDDLKNKNSNNYNQKIDYLVEKIDGLSNEIFDLKNRNKDKERLEEQRIKENNERIQENNENMDDLYEKLMYHNKKSPAIELLRNLFPVCIVFGTIFTVAGALVPSSITATGTINLIGIKMPSNFLVQMSFIGKIFLISGVALLTLGVISGFLYWLYYKVGPKTKHDIKKA